MIKINSIVIDWNECNQYKVQPGLFKKTLEENENFSNAKISIDRYLRASSDLSAENIGGVSSITFEEEGENSEIQSIYSEIKEIFISLVDKPFKD